MPVMPPIAYRIAAFLSFLAAILTRDTNLFVGGTVLLLLADVTGFAVGLDRGIQDTLATRK